MAGVLGFEPRNDGVKVRCLTAWLYPNIQYKKKWCSRQESNLRPLPYHGNALPTELQERGFRLLLLGNTLPGIPILSGY
jgi:hypothetical protein